MKRASFGESPLAMPSSIFRSRWNWSSSSSSCSTWRRRKRERSEAERCTASVEGAWDLLRRVWRSGLLESYDMRDGGREAAPIGGFFFQVLAAGPRKRVELGAAIERLGHQPAPETNLRRRPASQRRLAVPCFTQARTGRLDHCGMEGQRKHRFKRENLQEQKIQRALNQVRWFAHAFPSVTESKIHELPSVARGKSD